MIPRTPVRAAALAALILTAACAGGGDGDPDAATADAGVDASEVGCSATDPRAPATEVFVAPTGFEARMAGYIDGATDSLWIQMYLFTVDELVDRVVAAHQRGVEVRVLLDPDHDGNPDARGDLIAAGVPVRDAPSTFEFAHAKYLIIDGDTAVIMSANFNYGALDLERNYGAVTRDPDDIADLEAIFDSDWTQQGFADLDCTRLVVSPVNARQRVLQLVNSADATLDISAIYLADSSVRSAVIMAHDRGALVRVILADPTDFSENYDTATTLENQGITVRSLRTVDLHAKLIVADGVALVGSHNLSTTSLTANREVGLLVTEAAPVATIQAQFDADWAASVDF